VTVLIFTTRSGIINSGLVGIVPSQYGSGILQKVPAKRSHPFFQRFALVTLAAYLKSQQHLKLRIEAFDDG
jgi:hypothetical protein